MRHIVHKDTRRFFAEFSDADAYRAADELTLDDVVEICSKEGIEAKLFDMAGFVRGWVHADGSWMLR